MRGASVAISDETETAGRLSLVVTSLRTKDPLIFPEETVESSSPSEPRDPASAGMGEEMGHN